jgi:hypothetical protein
VPSTRERLGGRVAALPRNASQSPCRMLAPQPRKAVCHLGLNYRIINPASGRCRRSATPMRVVRDTRLPGVRLASDILLQARHGAPAGARGDAM